MKKVLKYLLVFIGVFTDVACHAQEKKDSVYWETCCSTRLNGKIGYSDTSSLLIKIKVTDSCQSLPSMRGAFKSVDIWFPRFWSWDIVNGFHSSDYNSVINPLEGRLSHFANLFYQSLHIVTNA